MNSLEIQLTQGNFLDQATDLAVIGLPQAAADLPIQINYQLLDQPTQARLQQLLVESQFRAEFLESYLFTLPASYPVKQLLVLGLGKTEELSSSRIRQLAAQASRQALNHKVRQLRLDLSCFQLPNLPLPTTVEAVTEGLLLGNYRFDRYKSDQKQKVAPLERAELFVRGEAQDLQPALERGEAIATAILNVRDIVNEPPNKIKPIHLVKAAQELAPLSPHLTVKVLDEAELKRQRYQAILGVSAGSDEKPYLIDISYRPKGAKTSLALVGKGVTFDSGGLGIKPWNHMLRMKGDMAGAAVVLGIIQALAELEHLGQAIPIAVHGIIATTENMISGKALKPDEIIETRSGKTIEVIHTDAEGRLILSDALTYAAELQPDYMLDFATLTGAVIKSLGLEYCGYMGNNQSLLDTVAAASRDSGELAWPLPLPEGYKRYLKSDIADLQNISINNSVPDAIFGGLFLAEFVNQIPWVHLDIAGPFFEEEGENPLYPKGATGYGILLGLRVLELLAKPQSKYL